MQLPGSVPMGRAISGGLLAMVGVVVALASLLGPTSALAETPAVATSAPVGRASDVVSSPVELDELSRPAAEVAAGPTATSTTSTIPPTTTSTTAPARALPNRYGYDVSWPQCDGPMPIGRGGFAVVGVTGGRPFSRNRCLAAEWQWAASTGAYGGVYVNLASPRDGDPRGMTGPAGSCGVTDWGCQAENFGWHTVGDALTHARTAGVWPPMWWLDVEGANHWTGAPGLNVRVVEGAVRALASAGHRAGVYSTLRYWREIMGDHRNGLPVWIASTTDQLGAPAWCDEAKAFTGGEVWLVQSLPGQFDVNWACAPLARAPQEAFVDLAR